MEHMAASLSQAIMDVLITKTLRAAKQYSAKGILLVGGVSASRTLRKQLGQAIKKELPGVHYFPSDRKFVTDNAAMIAAAGYWHVVRGDKEDWQTMELDPEWNIG
jgi:N6-L-threonylcarbamoyladenine synthase